MSPPGSPRALFESFEAVARAAPQRVVIRSAGGALMLNAAALSYRAEVLARELRAEGVGEGHLVLLQGLSDAPFVVAMLSVWACGAAALPADPQLAPPETDALRRAFAPRCVIRKGAGADLRAGAAGDAPVGPPIPQGTAALKLTSGSTGTPRGIAVTAGQLLADGRHIIEGMELRPEDVNIGAIPLSHSYGTGSLLLPLVIQGSPILTVPPLPDPLAEALAIEEPAVFPGVPYLFEMLARPDGPPLRPRGLRRCLSAGALLRARTAASFRERAGLPVRSFYGTSETGGIAYDASTEGADAIAAEGCVGTPLPGVRVTLEGEEGRVVVRGESVAAGYVGPAGEGGDGDFLGGAFRTGDIGRLDERGRLHLLGRIGSLVNVSGRKVNPREVERRLLELDGVRDAAALGAPDGARGESLVAFVAAGASMTRGRIVAHLRASLAPYKIPRRIIFMEALPRSLRGKLDRETLRRAALQEDESP